MLIARSTFSRASAWKGNQPRETLRSLSDEKGWYPFHDERVSPSKANPFQPRYANRRSVNLSEMVKPAIHDEVTCSNREDDRGRWGERALKEQRQVPGDPQKQGSNCYKIRFTRGTAETGNLLLAGGLKAYGLQLRNGRQIAVVNLNSIREYITFLRPLRKSDRSIVAKKWGNAHGAKGSSFSHVSIKIRRAA